MSVGHYGKSNGLGWQVGKQRRIYNVYGLQWYCRLYGETPLIFTILYTGCI